MLMSLILRGLSKMRAGGMSIGCENPGQSVVSKGDNRRAASTWSKCQHPVGGGRGWQAKAGGRVM